MKTFCGPRVGPCSASAAMNPSSSQPSGFLPDFQQIVPFAVQLVQALADALRRRTLAAPSATAARQREADLRIRERELGGDPRDLRRFRRVRLQELAARRQVVEEIADLDERPFGRPHFGDGSDDAAVDADLGPGLLAARTSAHQKMRDRGDGRQRLAAESQRDDGPQVVGPPDLARGVPLDGETRILGIHPCRRRPAPESASCPRARREWPGAWRRRRSRSRPAP